LKSEICWPANDSFGFIFGYHCCSSGQLKVSLFSNVIFHMPPKTFDSMFLDSTK